MLVFPFVKSPNYDGMFVFNFLSCFKIKVAQTMLLSRPPHQTRSPNGNLQVSRQRQWPVLIEYQDFSLSPPLEDHSYQ